MVELHERWAVAIASLEDQGEVGRVWAEYECGVAEGGQKVDERRDVVLSGGGKMLPVEEGALTGLLELLKRGALEMKKAVRDLRLPVCLFPLTPAVPVHDPG